MKAIVQTAYGSPEFFELREFEEPVIKDDEILVKVRSSALHAGDLFFMRGEPRMVRLMAGSPKPKNYIPGYDLAGTVEKIGRKVSRFKPGDEVFGGGQRTCAEYVRIKEKHVAARPSNLPLEEAGAVPTSALTALHGLRNVGKVKEGHKVLINGASGGVGTYAVQIARALGAEVTAVCSSRNTDLVRSLGAEHVIDYRETDFTKSEERYDLILDQVANHSLSACRRVLSPRGKHIPNSGNSGMAYVLKAMVSSLLFRKQGRTYLSNPNEADMHYLKELIEAGKLRPVIDKSFSLKDISEAFRHMDEVHAAGKVLIMVE